MLARGLGLSEIERWKIEDVTPRVDQDALARVLRRFVSSHGAGLGQFYSNFCNKHLDSGPDDPAQLPLALMLQFLCVALVEHPAAASDLGLEKRVPGLGALVTDVANALVAGRKDAGDRNLAWLENFGEARQAEEKCFAATCGDEATSACEGMDSKAEHVSSFGRRWAQYHAPGIPNDCCWWSCRDDETDWFWADAIIEHAAEQSTSWTCFREPGTDRRYWYNVVTEEFFFETP